MIIITNFKTYQTAMGKNAISLAHKHQTVAEETGITFAVAPSIIDLEKVVEECPHLPVFAQHVDFAEHGSYTGKIPPEYVKQMGVTGTILNHSENRIDREKLAKKAAKAKDAGLTVVMCAETVEEGVELMELCNPDFIAVEPPELIGGDISVSTANPEIIKDAVKQLGEGKVIVGAGVKNAEDVRIAKQLGASGILLASGVTKAADPETVLKDLASGVQS